MPKRTNEKQQIIEMLKEMTAAAGWAVTPSRLLLDARLGESFEVDVVAEKIDDGHIFIQSFEVIGKDRPATLAWAREMISKHESLPTDRLFLVSWSGFVANAKKAAKHYPWVTLVEPVAVQHGKVEGIGVIVEEVTFTLRQYMVQKKNEDGNTETIAITPSSFVVRADGTPQGHPETFAKALIHTPAFGARSSDEAHNHLLRETVSQFNASISLEADNLRLITNGIEHAIEEIRVRGDFAWRQERVDMTVREFAKFHFKHGKATIGGRPHVIVASLNNNLDAVKLRTAPEAVTEDKAAKATKRRRSRVIDKKSKAV